MEILNVIIFLYYSSELPFKNAFKYHNGLGRGVKREGEVPQPIKTVFQNILRSFRQIDIPYKFCPDCWEFMQNFNPQNFCSSNHCALSIGLLLDDSFEFNQIFISLSNLLSRLLRFDRIELRESRHWDEIYIMKCILLQTCSKSSQRLPNFSYKLRHKFFWVSWKFLRRYWTSSWRGFKCHTRFLKES